MHFKKAQVTPFIIIGLVVAAILFFVFFFFGDRLIQQTQDTTPLDRAQLIPLTQHIENCMQVSLDKEFDSLKRNSGYLSTTPYYTQYGGANINYLIYPENAINKMNSLSAVEATISTQVETDIKSSCPLDKFKLNIKDDKPKIKAQTVISENKIILTLNYPLTITKGKTSAQLTDFSISKETDFGKIYNTVSDIVETELSGEFDQYQYQLANPLIVIDKFNIDINNAIYLVTSNKEQDYLIFAVKKA